MAAYAYHETTSGKIICFEGRQKIYLHYSDRSTRLLYVRNDEPKVTQIPTTIHDIPLMKVNGISYGSNQDGDSGFYGWIQDGGKKLSWT
jgi:hypothetical protein